MLPGNSATQLAPPTPPTPPEPIAVVGMACRFPGTPGLDESWQLLRDGRDEITEIPADRVDIERELVPWPATERALAGVRSFGISRTNVHVLLEGMQGRPGNTAAN